jgi:HYR domain
MTCPSDIFLTTCSNGAPAFFNVTATNRCYTNLTITCALAAGAGIPVASGTVFPVGTNIVICTASDTAGHRTNCSFRVIVTRDSLPPEIRCPRDVVYLCGTSGTNVFYNVHVTDDTDPAPVVTCVPPSGSFFPAGTNTVTCEARDACGRISRCSFKVIMAPNGFTKTIQAGIADDFVPAAFEPTVTSPCLGGSGFWSGMPFDTSWPSRYLSHSFGGLPLNISAAKLTLHMKPTQSASQDDVLRIGLQNCGGLGVWAFAQQVASLPGAGGTWNVNSPTAFTLDLAALPGGINLLAGLNTDHCLEFAVGTETMVDYARLEVTYCGPQTTLSGVPYSLNNVYPIHQGGGGVSWRTVNSNSPTILDIDGGGADGIRWDFDFDLDLFSFC